MKKCKMANGKIRKDNFYLDFRRNNGELLTSNQTKLLEIRKDNDIKSGS